jgi:hypothetical protein
MQNAQQAASLGEAEELIALGSRQPSVLIDLGEVGQPRSILFGEAQLEQDARSLWSEFGLAVKK